MVVTNTPLSGKMVLLRKSASQLLLESAHRCCVSFFIMVPNSTQGCHVWDIYSIGEKNAVKAIFPWLVCWYWKVWLGLGSLTNNALVFLVQGEPFITCIMGAPRGPGWEHTPLVPATEWTTSQRCGWWSAQVQWGLSGAGCILTHTLQCRTELEERTCLNQPRLCLHILWGIGLVSPAVRQNLRGTWWTFCTVLEDECPSKIISLKGLILTAPTCQERAQPCQGRRGASFPWFSPGLGATRNTSSHAPEN